MHYHSLGQIPHKRHTQFRKPDGSLYAEELFSTEGFSDVYSLLYHLNPPTMIRQYGEPFSVAPKMITDNQLKPRCLKGFQIPPEDDYLKSRKPVLVNHDCKIILAAPRKSMTDYFFKNADSDEMIFIQNFLQKKGIQAKMIGVDANPKAIAYAKLRCKDHPDFDWICASFQEIKDLNADVIHCSLFAHHFYDRDLIALATLLHTSKIGFIVNDLHRNWLAYHSISILTRLFSKSYLVRNDARLSVAKGFSKTEIEAIFFKPGLSSFFAKWKWAFRWQVVGKI
jgi:homogentisate 1,2-dioxygenase